MFLKIVFRNVFSKRSSYIIILFMTFILTLFCLANALIDSTEQGVQSCFVSSFTGDVVIRPCSKGQMSLFGDETPVTGVLTKLEKIVPYQIIESLLLENQNIESIVPQVTGMAALDFNGQKKPVYVFGVDADSYTKVMKSLQIRDGIIYETDIKGGMVSVNVAESMGINVGDYIQFVVADGPYVRIRKVPVTAIYYYETENPMLDRFVLVDPDTARSLMDIDNSVVVADEYIEEEKSYLLDENLDFDSLFDDAEDFISNSFESSFDKEKITQDPVLETEALRSATWNYIICKTNNNKPKELIKYLNKTFRKNEWSVEAVDWRHAAGSTALYLYWLRLILNTGILIVLFAGFIIVNNTLTINVLDSTREIGTMRAVGAKKRFISAQCMAETFVMSTLSGFLGCIFGIILANTICKVHISFSNLYLQQLFGSSCLFITVSIKNILEILIFSFLLGAISWIYPVINALKINPVKAMQGAK